MKIYLALTRFILMVGLLAVAMTAAKAGNSSNSAHELEKISSFGKYQGYSVPRYDGFKRESQYVPVRDGTRLAVDLFFPANDGVKAEGKFPTLFWFTGYGRAKYTTSGSIVHLLEGRGNETRIARNLLSHGYIIIAVDLRGVGASFGPPVSYKNADQMQDIQGRDGYDVLEWAARQSWSTGNAGLFGTSWMALIQPIIAATKPPSLKAIFPMQHWFGYDLQVAPISFKRYTESVAKMNRYRGNKGIKEHLKIDGIYGDIVPVDGPAGPKLLQQALTERLGYESPKFDDNSIFDFWAREEPLLGKDARRLEVPMYSWQGLYDSEPIAPVLWKVNAKAPVKAVVGPWTHGADEPNDAKGEAQKTLNLVESLRWFDYWLKGIENDVMEEPSIRYAVIGKKADSKTWLRDTDEWAWIETEQWPPSGVKRQRLYLGEGGGLNTENKNNEGLASFSVDYSATVGDTGRYPDGGGQGPIHYPELSELNRKGAVFTSEILKEDIALIGAPVVQLKIRSTAASGQVHVFLEKVLADDSSIFITNGMTLASRRTLGKPSFDNLGLPYLNRDREVIKAVAPFNAGISTVNFPLVHTGIVFEKGSRIRLAITGADAGTYPQKPCDASPEYTVYVGGEYESWISLPLVSDISSLSFLKWKTGGEFGREREKR